MSESTLAVARLPRLTGKSLLVVEDDPDSLAMLHIALTMQGALVKQAHSVVEAMSVLEFEAPDLIITDLLMPDHNGFELIRQVRDTARLSGVRVIAVTGMKSPEDRERVFAAGFDEYMPKPFGVEDLIRTVHRLTRD